MLKSTPPYDVVIIGGGCAGASTTLSLLREGVENIAIVEKNDFSKPRIGETIQPPTAQLLKELGVWAEFLKDGHLPSSGVASAWGTGELAFSDFIFTTHGNGWHLNRNVFDRMMLRMAVQNGAQLFNQTRLTRASLIDKHWSLECGNTILQARFVVDASGRANAFAKHQGSHKIQFDNLHGIYTYWRQPEDSEVKFGTSHTLVESVENGWWYSALLPNNELAVAFMTDTREIKNRGLKERENYLACLERAPHTFQRVSGHTVQSLPTVKVATAYELDRITGDGWLAVGDSASTFDPLSSYGIHKALHNGIEAGVCIKSALEGDYSPLKSYEQQIKKEFESFLETRFKYYGMETRWPEQPFWKSRQQMIGVHPEQELTLKSSTRKGPHRWNKILAETDLNTLITSCEQPKTAVALVREFQKKSKKKYPDWRVIQAVSYLYEMEAIG